MNFKGLRGVATVSAVALVALCAVPAGAQSGGKPGAGAAPPPRTGAPADTAAPRGTMPLRFDAKSCTAEDRAAVNEAFVLARERVAVGLRHVRETPDSPNVRMWFGTGPRKQITHVLDAVNRRLAQPETFTISCNDNLCRQGPMAYTVPQESRMGFCAGFFRARLTGEDSRYGTVVHEMTHLAARTQDHIYGRTRARGLSTKQPEIATNNADSYEYFIETLFE